MSAPVQPPLTVETIDGATVGRPITKIKVTNGTLAVSGSTATLTISGGGGGSGTVTSVGTSQAFITITNPTTTPSISIGNASGAATGVLTATDWTTFNSKAPNTSSYLTLGTDAGLTNERVLTAGTGISFTDTGAGGTLTIETTGGGGGGIGGSGTIGTVPVFVTDTTTLGDSRLVQSGSTDMIYSASSGAAFSVKSNDGNEPNFKMLTSGSQGLRFELTDQNTITLKKVGTNTLRFRSSGTAFTIFDNTSSTDGIFSATYSTGAIKINNAYTLPTAVTGVNDYVLTAQTDGSTAWAASGGGGGVTFPLEGSDGTTAAPTYSFSTDTNTGMYLSAADTIGFSVGGNERLKIANNAIEGITFRVDGTDTAASPGYSFDPDNDTGMFSTGATSNTLSFSTGGTERLRIGDSGEILIGGTAAGTSGQVLTSGGASAAITWSDAGGGNEFNAELVGVELDASGTGYDVFDILSAPPYGVARYTTGSVDAKQYFYPFIAPATGNLSELIVNITSAAGSATNLYYGFYRDNNGVPSTVLGYATVDATSTGNISVTSFSGTISLTRGNQFWVSQNKSTSQSITQRSIQNDYLPRIAPSSSFPSTTSGYSASLASNASVTAVPADVTAEGLEGGVYFSGLGAKPHIGVKIT